MTTPIKAARFLVYKDLTGFDFASIEVNEALVRQLHRCEFTEKVDHVFVHRPFKDTPELERASTKHESRLVGTCKR